jgi:hypothetical protein
MTPAADDTGGVHSIALALRLTAIELLLRPMGPWGVRPLILVTAGFVLLFPRALGSALSWYALAGLVAARVIADWPLPDNHVFLLAYWCLAIGLALGAGTPARVLATSARLLLGLAFLLSVIWKAVLSPDFTDGRFFTVTLLTDGRFEHAVQVFGGLSKEELDINRQSLSALPEGAELLNPPPFIAPPAFTRLVWVSTWGVLGIEALLAVACLVPRDGWVHMARHVLLLGFCGVTYAFAPVAGFGWLLLAMGVALTSPSERILRAAYVGTWFLVLLYSEVPWTQLLAGLLGGS